MPSDNQRWNGRCSVIIVHYFFNFNFLKRAPKFVFERGNRRARAVNDSHVSRSSRTIEPHASFAFRSCRDRSTVFPPGLGEKGAFHVGERAASRADDHVVVR